MKKSGKNKKVLFLTLSMMLPLLFLGTGCQKYWKPDMKAVGYEPPTPQEKKHYRVATTAQMKKDKATEKDSWGQLLQDYPDSYYAGKAHLRLGFFAYQNKKWRLASMHLTSAKKGALKLQQLRKVNLMLGESLYHDKQYKKAIKLLTKEVPNLKGKKQQRALIVLANSSGRLEKHSEALKWRLRIYQALSQAKRPAFRKQLQADLQKLNIRQLKALHREHTDMRHFPGDQIAYSLAMQYYEQQKLAESEKVLKPLFSQLSDSHPFRQKSAQVLERIKIALRAGAAHTIGVIFPETGKGSPLSAMIRNAVELARRSHPKLRVIYMDSASEPETAVSAVKTLVKRHNVLAIFGPVLSSVAIPAAKKAQELGVPMYSITIKAGFPQVGSYIFRNNLTPEQMSRAVARYAVRRLKVDRFGIFSSEDEYGKKQTKAFQEEVERLGGKVTRVKTYPTRTRSFHWRLRSLVSGVYSNKVNIKNYISSGMSGYQKRRLKRKYKDNLKPLPPFEALFIPETASKLSLIAPHLTSLNVRTKRIKLDRTAPRSDREHFSRIQLLGSNSWNSYTLFRTGHEHVRGGIFCVRYDARSKSRHVRKFKNDYRKKFKRNPIHISAYTFDTINILAKIASSSKVQTRFEFRNALTRVKNVKGVTGKLSILQGGETQSPLRFLSVSGRTFVLHGISSAIESRTAN